jgi:hypothetical protein
MRIKAILIIIALTYFALCAGMFIFQRSLLFIGSGPIDPPAKYGLEGFNDAFLSAPDKSQIRLWWSDNSKAKNVVVLFFGNADTLPNYADFFKYLRSKDIAVVGICYRSYCGAKGSPSEENLYADGRAAIGFATSVFPNSKITLVGRSLGTGVATQMATEYKIKNLVLLSPYTSIPDVAEKIYWYLPVSFFARDHFDNASKIASVTSNILIFHGNFDNIIPFSHSQKLVDLTGGKAKLIELKGVGHNNIDLLNIAPTIVRFINAD